MKSTSNLVQHGPTAAGDANREVHAVAQRSLGRHYQPGEQM